MKKIIALLLCLGIFAVSAAGCFGMGGGQVTATGDEAASLNEADYPDDLDGLCRYLSAHGYINTVDQNSSIEMQASLIGASKGRKFDCKIKNISNTFIELYEYDLSNLNETANQVRKSVKENGTFTVLELDPVKNVYLSDSGKYLMIYNDPSIDNEKPDENSENFKKRTECLDLFLPFKNK